MVNNLKKLQTLGIQKRDGWKEILEKWFPKIKSIKLKKILMEKKVIALLKTIIIKSKKMKEKKSIKRSVLKINNIVLKQIKEYPKVTYHREKWFWTKNGI